jgi:DNA-binding transcriptional ArsR family regulator
MPVGRATLPTTFRERYADWLKLVLKRYPDVKRPLLASIDAYESCRGRKTITRDMLAPIVAAASSKRSPLRGSSTDFLAEFTWKHPAARDAVREMAASPDAKARFNAVLSVGRGSPRDFRIAVLRQVIADKCAAVRWRAAESAAWVHDLVELLPDLQRAFAAETNLKTKQTLDHAVRILRDGHIAEREQDGKWRLNYRGPQGESVTFWADPAEVSRDGFQAVIAEHRQRA